SSDYYLDNLALYIVLFEKEVDLGGTVYRNVVRKVSNPVFVTMRSGSTFEYSYTFTVPPSVTDPVHNLGAVAFVQDTVTKRIHQADVLDLREKRFVYEVDVDADFDGRAEEVEFAIECTKIPFLGVQGNAWARFNVYLLTDYGVLFPMCCDTPFFEDEVARWDLEIFKRNNLGYILVKVCDPFDIHCLEPGDVIYGPRHLARIEIVNITETDVTFWFQFMKIIETEVQGEVKVEPSSLLRLASEVTEADLRKYNVVTVGGPDVNPFTRRIVDMGLSAIDWSESRGELEFIANPFGYGTDVLIVAGKDREKTSFAAKKLYYALELYEE
ncbi:MAG: S-layer protein, partial [Theionarchaea archaeon]|nr:S-layer protein [Theionarchaea archaeon]